MGLKLFKEQDCGLREVVVTTSYYSLHFMREILSWFDEYAGKDELHELRRFLGEELSDNIRDIKQGDGGLQHTYTVIWNMLEVLGEHVDDISNGVEDFRFYCEEYLRGIESVLKLGQDLGKGLGIDMDPVIWEYLEEQMG